jgi:DNA gyrase subunit B
MYIGSTGQRGLHHLIFEIVDNCIDEALAGFCDYITVTLNSDGSVEITDNGRGIPCSIHPTTGKSALETVLCVLHAGGKFGGEDSGYKVSGGLHGVGVSVVNALSESLTVQVARDSKLHTMEFAKGIPQTDLIISDLIGDFRQGTKVKFSPDPSIFKTTTVFDFDKLANRLDELAYLNAGLTIKLEDLRGNVKSIAPSSDEEFKSDEADSRGLHTTVTDDAVSNLQKMKIKKPKRKNFINQSIKDEEESPHESESSSLNELANLTHTSRVEVYRHDGGINELVEVLCADKINLHPEVNVISVKDERKGIAVEVGLRWSKDLYTDFIIGFANSIRTSDGGTHLDGVKTAVTRTINVMAKQHNKLKENAPNIPGEFIREGLTAVVSVKVPEPEFEGQTKTRLGNPEVRSLVDAIVSDALTTTLEWNLPVLSAIVGKALEAQNAALAARAARDLVRRKTLLTNTVLPGKLADCSSRSPSETELYIVEGDSAAGSAKLGRDRRFQAILPLRGKILNIEKSSNDKIYSNTELQAVISAVGLGIRGSEFDLDSLRYHKVIIMTDADVDGSHIRILLLTFFYRYQRELVERGHVYVACPPLYKVTTKGKGGQEKYIFDDPSLQQYLSSLPDDLNPQIQRFKGLGMSS